MSIEISLPESLTIHQIDENYSQLLEKLSVSEESITLDGSNVESIDTSGLQALIVLIRTAQESDKQIQWQNASDVLKESAQKVGLSEALLFA